MVDLRPGSRLWLDGQVWSVVELRADGAMIAAGSVHRTMPIAALVDRAHLMDAPSPPQLAMPWSTCR